MAGMNARTAPVQPLRGPCAGSGTGASWNRFVDLAWHRPKAAAVLAAPTGNLVDGDTPDLPCLTHHEMLSLIDPFVRQGRRLDLCASDRRERRLVFKPVPLGEGGLHDTLALCSPAPGRLVLARLLSDEAGSPLQACVQAEGSDAATLLARVQAVPVTLLWQTGPGWTVAHDRWLAEHDAGGALLTGSAVRLPYLMLQLDATAGGGRSATLALQALPDGDGTGPATLPDDLLAVLGWAWSALRPLPGGGWSASLRLRGGPVQRSREAEARLRQVIHHLARTLAQPPQAYHRTLRAARYGVALRRSIPLMFYGALGALAALAQPLQLASDPMPGALLLAAPPALLMLFYCRSEAPRLELPPWPRPLRGRGWQSGGREAQGRR